MKYTLIFELIFFFVTVYVKTPVFWVNDVLPGNNEPPTLNGACPQLEIQAKAVNPVNGMRATGAYNLLAWDKYFSIQNKSKNS